MRQLRKSIYVVPPESNEDESEDIESENENENDDNNTSKRWSGRQKLAVKQRI